VAKYHSLRAASRTAPAGSERQNARPFRKKWLLVAPQLPSVSAATIVRASMFCWIRFSEIPGIAW
jgi:hypothetical protein